MPAGQSPGMASFGPSMLTGGQGAVKSMPQPFSGQASASSHAFMPTMQHSALQPGMNHTPLLQNGNAYPMHPSQGLQYTAPMPMSQQSLQNRQIAAQLSTQAGQPGNSQGVHAGNFGLLNQVKVSSAQSM